MFHDTSTSYRRLFARRPRWLAALAPLVLAAVLVTPVAAQAAPPQWFINGRLAEATHEPWFGQGKIELKNEDLKTITCHVYLSGSAWNEVKEGVSRGFVEINGFYTHECEAVGGRCEVANERGVKKEGISVTAEGPPTFLTEKARHSGNTSLPWTGELIEKQNAGLELGRYVLIHNMKIWFDTPLSKAQGGPGEGIFCELIGGKELPLEEKEGATEKAAGYELAPRIINGSKNGLKPSHLEFDGEIKEPGGAPETGRLINSIVGDWFVTGQVTGPSAPSYELVTAE